MFITKCNATDFFRFNTVIDQDCRNCIVSKLRYIFFAEFIIKDDCAITVGLNNVF